MSHAFDRVVLVDDNRYDNEYHEIVLRTAGWEGELVAFQSGQAGLDFLESTSPVRTLIFLDINMPRMNGFEFAQKAAPRLAALPKATVVVLTSSPAREDVARALSNPQVCGYVIKPLLVPVAARLLAGELPDPPASI